MTVKNFEITTGLLLAAINNNNVRLRMSQKYNHSPARCMCVGTHFIFWLFVLRKFDRIIARVSNVPVRICMSCVFWHHQHPKIFSVHVHFYVDSFALIFNALTNTHFHKFDLSYHHSRKRNDRFMCLCLCVGGFFIVSFHLSLLFSSCIFWHIKSHSLCCRCCCCGCESPFSVIIYVYL